MTSKRLRWVAIMAAVLPIPSSMAAQELLEDGQVVLRLVVAAAACMGVDDCPVKDLDTVGVELPTIRSTPGERFAVRLENRGDRPYYGALMVLSTQERLGRVTWPRPIGPGETLLTPDTILVDETPATDLFVVLTAQRYFTPEDVPEVVCETVNEAGRWLIGDILHCLSANDVGLVISAIYFHVTDPGSGSGVFWW